MADEDIVSPLDRAKLKFFDSLERMPPDASLNEREQEALLNLLNSKVFRKAAALGFREIGDAGTNMLKYNLEDPVMRAKATMLQGRAQGMVRAYEGLFEQIEDSRYTHEVDESNG